MFRKNVLTAVIFVFVFFAISTAFPLQATKIATLTDIMKPSGIDVGDGFIYITEKTTIYIYSARNFSLVKKFGQMGEGPSEFKGYADIAIQPDHLLINSAGKLSYFTSEGKFIKELKAGAGLGNAKFFPLQKGFVGKGTARDAGKHYQTINFFDAQLQKGKELYRLPMPVDKAGKIQLLSRSFIYRTHANRIYAAGKEGFIIDVLDHEGTHLFSINQKLRRRPFTAADETAVRQVVKEVYHQHYQRLKNRLSFPQYFPEIMDFFIADNKLYTATWQIKDTKIQFFIFDLTGKPLASPYIPFLFENPVQPYPASIKKGKLYQVVENEETEEWELHMSPVR